jgi:hypothetical protein
MARKTLARKAELATGRSGGIDQVSAALHKLHAAYADQVAEAMRNSSASRREVAIQPLRQPE